MSIRTVIAALSVVFVALTAALLWLVFAERENATELAQAEARRHASYQAAIELMQTSNDLTRMARLYVATGDPAFAGDYRRILDIRAGRAPRPSDYDPFYWDRVLAGNQALDESSPPQALRARLQALQFTRSELDALSSAQDESERLAGIEEQAMRSIGEKAAALGPGQRLDNAAEIDATVNAEYQQAKGRIMAGIQDCLQQVDARTREAAGLLAAQGRAIRNGLLLCAGFELLLGLVLVGIVAWWILRPVDRLVLAAHAVEREDYSTRVPRQRTVEFERLGQAFNQMTAAIQGDIARRVAIQAELAQARDDAQAATRAKSVFLATMSHEIRTPMIGVTGMLEVLSYSPLNPDQRREIAVIQQSAQALLTIISDVLDFSKIEAGRLDIAPTAISLRDVVDATVQNFVPAASSVGLPLIASYDARVAPAHLADPVRIRQILSNFLSNALKFTKEGRVDVVVSVTGDDPDGQSLLFSVKDTGIGISEEAQARLFQPFQQAESGTTRKFGGTGLGLSISRRLAELMGGTITLESRPGVGTTMFLRVTLPLADAAALEAAERGPSIAVSRSRPATREAAIADGSLLLLAEDHPTNRLVLARQFDLAGFWIDIVEDGALAFERWKKGGYGAVFTDLHMPVMDGLQFARAIREHETAHGMARTPVLALTAAAMKEDAERAIAAGMDDVIVKPTTVPVLAGKLRQWLPGLSWDSVSGGRAADALPGTQGHFDPAVLGELSGGDAELAREILKDFLAATHADVELIPALVAQRDLEPLTRRAHRIVGSSRMVGATALAEVAARLEVACRTSDWTAVAQTAPEVVNLFATLEAAGA